MKQIKPQKEYGGNGMNGSGLDGKTKMVIG